MLRRIKSGIFRRFLLFGDGARHCGARDALTASVQNLRLPIRCPTVALAPGVLLKRLLPRVIMPIMLGDPSISGARREASDVR